MWNSLATVGGREEVLPQDNVITGLGRPSGTLRGAEDWGEAPSHFRWRQSSGTAQGPAVLSAYSSGLALSVVFRLDAGSPPIRR